MNHPLLSLYKKNEKFIFLALTLFFGVLVLSNIVNYQALLSQGDHGRDLYAFQRTLKGDIPYIDYWWVYGPLMPYYYSLFFIILGTSMSSVLIGKTFLVLFSSVFFFSTLSLLAPPVLAFLAACWLFLFNPDFFFTYNHAGGITVIFALNYFICLYLKDQKTNHLYLILACIFILSLIKINFGVFAYICSLFAIFLIDKTFTGRFFCKRKKTFYLLTFLVLPVAIFTVYYSLLRALPIHEIRQCLPYLSEDHPYNSPLSSSVLQLMQSIKNNMVATLPDLFFALIILLSIGQIILLLSGRSQAKESHKTYFARWITKKHIILFFIIFSFFYICFSHEFFASGVHYRSFWAKPFTLLLMFSVIAFGTNNLSKPIKFLLYIALALIVGLTTSTALTNLNTAKTPSQYLPLENTHIYVGNSPGWIATAVNTTHYLRNNLKEDETFFALPYDPLYYFLTDKKSPTRQLIFFEHINIPVEQERKIIAELEQNKVNWILVSSRSKAMEPGLGRFGVTYCPFLGNYIKNNFEITAEFGDWFNEPLWAHNHGTRILRRK